MKYLPFLVLCLAALTVGPQECARSGPVADGGAGLSDPTGTVNPHRCRYVWRKGKRIRVHSVPCVCPG